MGVNEGRKYGSSGSTGVPRRLARASQLTSQTAALVQAQGPVSTDNAARLVGGRHFLISPGPRALCPEQATQGGPKGRKEKHKLARALLICPFLHDVRGLPLYPWGPEESACSCTVRQLRLKRLEQQDGVRSCRMGESHDELRPLQRHWALAVRRNHNMMSKHNGLRDQRVLLTEQDV